MNQLLPDPEKNEDVHFPGIDFDRILNRNSFVTFLTFTGNHLELCQKLKDIKTGTEHFPKVTFSENSSLGET